MITLDQRSAVGVRVGCSTSSCPQLPTVAAAEPEAATETAMAFAVRRASSSTPVEILKGKGLCWIIDVQHVASAALCVPHRHTCSLSLRSEGTTTQVTSHVAGECSSITAPFHLVGTPHERGPKSHIGRGNRPDKEEAPVRTEEEATVPIRKRHQSGQGRGPGRRSPRPHTHLKWSTTVPPHQQQYHC